MPLALRPAEFAKHLFGCLLCIACVFPGADLNAGTLVRINTPLGGITLELFDDVAPNTVKNFLNYVNSGRYNNTFIHRSENSPTPFVIQGGWLRFDEPTQGLSSIPNDGTIANEFRLSNLRGTVAMAKAAGNPNSATSQWFVNLSNNTFLDTDNGGFTVFGRIVDNGMSVVDAIAALPRYQLLQELPTVPLINFTALPLKNANFVTLSMAVMNHPTAQPNVFDTNANLLYTQVNAGSDGLVSLAFAVHSLAPEVVLQALPSSVKILSAPVSKMATFNSTTGHITIPEFIVNGAVAYRNVVLELSDAAALRFRLVAFD